MFRFFISSTFNDMHHERDIIQKKVFSKVNSYVSRFGESVYFSDLRWGVNTVGLDEEAASRKIIKTCIEEVNNCSPYMIVILGDRYGTVMDDIVVNDYTEKNELDKCSGISLTALEILAGEKFCGLQNILFYFREIEGDYPQNIFEDDYHNGKEKLKELKEKIKKSGAIVRKYIVQWNEDSHDIEGFEQFANYIVKDVESIISSNHGHNDKGTLFAENIAARSYISNELFSKVSESLKQEKTIVIFGGEGCGKTTIASCIVKRLHDTGEYSVYPIFIKDDYYEEHSGVTIEEYIDKCLSKYSNKDKTLFVIDGLDIVSDPIKERKIIDSIISKFRKTAEHCKLITTSSVRILPDEVAIISLENRLNEESIGGLQSTLLSGKEISNEVKTAIVKKCFGKEYLYEKILLQRLDMMTANDYFLIKDYQKKNKASGVDAAVAIQKQIITKIPDDMCEFVFKTCLDFASDYDKESLYKSLWLIANSLDGFMLDDLVRILKIETNKDDILVFLISACKDIFTRKPNGKIDFISLKIKSYFQGKMRNYVEVFEDSMAESVFWALNSNEMRNKYEDEALFWDFKAGLPNRENVELFLNMNANSRSKILRLFDEQNVITEIRSEKDINANVTWAKSLGDSIDNYNMNSRSITLYSHLLSEFMEEKSVHRYINLAYLLTSIKEEIKNKIDAQKKLSDLLGENTFTGHWKSEWNHALVLQLKIYDYLKLDSTYLRDEFEKREIELAEYYDDDPITLINKGIFLISDRSDEYDYYYELIEISEKIIGMSEEIRKRYELREDKCLEAAAYVIDMTGNMAAMSFRDINKAMDLYKSAFGFWNTCRELGKDSWEIRTNIGLFFYKMAVCMEAIGKNTGCVNKFYLNSKEWLKSGYHECDNNKADFILETLKLIDEKIKNFE